MGRRDRTRRCWSVSGLISFGGHAALVAATLVGGVPHRGRLSASLAASTAESIRVELTELSSVASPAMAARPEAGRAVSPLARPRARGLRRRPREPPLPPLPPGPSPLQPPPFHQLAAAPAIATGAPSTPSAPTRPAPPPTPASQELPTIDAAYLRIEETYPRLPSSMLIAGRTYSEFVRLCVDTDGRVASVEITRGAAAELDALVRAAIRTWRYRPYVVDGGPHAFCHRMILHFEVE